MATKQKPLVIKIEVKPTKPLPQVAVDRLNTIADYIVANPDEYCQSSFRSCIAFFNSKLFASDRTHKQRMKKHDEWLTSSCSTEDRIFSNPIFAAAAKEMKLTKDQAWRIFSDSQFWPNRFQLYYGIGWSVKKRARVAFRRIKHFIKTNGDE